MPVRAMGDSGPSEELAEVEEELMGKKSEEEAEYVSVSSVISVRTLTHTDSPSLHVP